MGIARHKVVDYQRRHYRDKLLFNTEVLERVSDACVSVADESAERRWALDICVGKLHDRGRKMLELRYTHGLTPPQIGDRVGMTGNAVAVSLHRVRKALSDCVRRQLAKGDRR